MKKSIFILMLSAATFAAKHSDAQVRTSAINNVSVRPLTVINASAKAAVPISYGVKTSVLADINRPPILADKNDNSDNNIPPQVNITGSITTDGHSVTATGTASGDGTTVVAIVAIVAIVVICCL